MSMHATYVCETHPDVMLHQCRCYSPGKPKMTAPCPGPRICFGAATEAEVLRTRGDEVHYIAGDLYELADGIQSVHARQGHAGWLVVFRTANGQLGPYAIDQAVRSGLLIHHPSDLDGPSNDDWIAAAYENRPPIPANLQALIADDIAFNDKEPRR